MPTGRDEVGDKNSPRRGEVRSWKERVSAKRTHDRREEGKAEREREIPRAVGRPRGCRPHGSHGHVPNNSLGTRKQLLRNSCYRATLRVYISPSVATRAFRTPSTQSVPRGKPFASPSIPSTVSRASISISKSREKERKPYRLLGSNKDLSIDPQTVKRFSRWSDIISVINWLSSVRSEVLDQAYLRREGKSDVSRPASFRRIVLDIGQSRFSISSRYGIRHFQGRKSARVEFSSVNSGSSVGHLTFRITCLARFQKKLQLFSNRSTIFVRPRISSDLDDIYASSVARERNISRNKRRKKERKERKAKRNAGDPDRASAASSPFVPVISPAKYIPIV